MATLGALALVLCAAALLWWRVEPLVRAVLEARADAARAEAEARRAAVAVTLAAPSDASNAALGAESRKQSDAPPPPVPAAPRPTPRPDPMPPFLAQLAESESEPWAREDVLAAIDEAFVEYGRDWAAVTALVHGTRVLPPSSREATP
jgi:hypothetical protein